MIDDDLITLLQSHTFAANPDLTAEPTIRRATEELTTHPDGEIIVTFVKLINTKIYQGFKSETYSIILRLKHDSLTKVKALSTEINNALTTETRSSNSNQYEITYDLDLSGFLGSEMDVVITAEVKA